jgi:hypothetical protein
MRIFMRVGGTYSELIVRLIEEAFGLIRCEAEGI